MIAYRKQPVFIMRERGRMSERHTMTTMGFVRRGRYVTTPHTPNCKQRISARRADSRCHTQPVAGIGDERMGRDAIPPITPTREQC